MAWFAELAGKAEHLLNNLDEQTGAALRSHNVLKQKNQERKEYSPQSDTLWNQKRRPIPRALKKIPAVSDRSNHSPLRPTSPTSRHSPAPDSEGRDHSHKCIPQKSRKSPTKKPFNLNNSPKTLVESEDSDLADSGFNKKRRSSLPADLDGNSLESLTYRMENMEVENAMLKNEINVMNREVTDLLSRLHETQNELQKTNTKLEKSDAVSQKASMDNEFLTRQLDQLKLQIHNLTSVEIARHLEHIQALENDISNGKEKNKHLEQECLQLKNKTDDNEFVQTKLETELRQAQSTINSLQNDFEKCNAECRRLEKDWESYKHRVKSMLSVKDKEIKALQNGINIKEDTKTLIDQIENLKAEREQLSDMLVRVQGECDDMKQYMKSTETRHAAAERVVLVLREALKDERSARNRAEAQCNAVFKDIKTIQIDTSQAIASLRTALREKESELTHLRESTTTVESTQASALNVADYDRFNESVDGNKVDLLTQKLVQKQGKIEELLAENNMMKIQMDKLETKYKTEMKIIRSTPHSVVHFQDGDRHRHRSTHTSESALVLVSRRIGVFLRRNPIFRFLIIIYMVGLHFWVLTVLLTSTPENYITRPIIKS